MRENASIAVYGKKVLLVPYDAHHVAKYHKWMESDELRELTASERLTLEQEYHMQEKWRDDNDKCTFIILDKEKYEKISESSCTRETDSMIGDVNIFYQDEDRLEGEVEIMIAEPSAQGKGFGKEALCSMMRYAQEVLKTKTFTSKIGFANTTSLHLFKCLGFTEISRSDVFQEITLSFDTSDAFCFYPWTEGYHIKSIKQ